MKSGVTTSEFWVAIASTVLPVINRLYELDLPIESIYGLIAYIVGRSWVKSKKETED